MRECGFWSGSALHQDFGIQSALVAAKFMMKLRMVALARNVSNLEQECAFGYSID